MIAGKNDLRGLAHGDPAPRLQSLRRFVDDDHVESWRRPQQLVAAARAGGGDDFARGKHLSAVLKCNKCRWR